MPKKKTSTGEKEKLVGLTVRLPERDSRLFNALLSLRGESANDVLKKTALDYIKKYENLLNMEEIQKKHDANVKSPFSVFRKTKDEE